jgi:hypothetical protein
MLYGSYCTQGDFRDLSESRSPVYKSQLSVTRVTKA